MAGRRPHCECEAPPMARISDHGPLVPFGEGALFFTDGERLFDARAAVARLVAAKCRRSCAGWSRSIMSVASDAGGGLGAGDELDAVRPLLRLHRTFGFKLQDAGCSRRGYRLQS